MRKKEFGLACGVDEFGVFVYKSEESASLRLWSVLSDVAVLWECWGFGLGSEFGFLDECDVDVMFMEDMGKF